MIQPSFAIAGKMRSGKDTVTKILGDTLTKNNIKFRELKFADPIHKVCAQLETYDALPPALARQGINDTLEEFLSMVNPFIHSDHKVDINQLYKIIEATPNSSGKNRPRIRGIAEYIREISPNVWIDLLDGKVKSLVSQDKTFIISDMRFKKEAEWAEHAGVYRIHISVLPEIQRNRLITTGVDPDTIGINMISETDLDDYTKFTYHITNNDSYTDLLQSVSTMTSRLLTTAEDVSSIFS